MANQTAEFYCHRLQELRKDRTHFEQQWEEVAERIVPAHKNTFTSWGYSNESNRGRKNQEKMMDATGALALQRFIPVMESLTIPQASLWHRLVPSEPSLRKNRVVRQYLDDINALLFRYRYRPSANFVMQAQKTYMSYGAYGNGLMFVDELDNGDVGLRYKNLHLGETYLAENHQGIVDTMYRSFHLRADQLVKMFPEAPKEVVDKAKSTNQSQTPFEVLHVIVPNDDYSPGKLGKLGARYKAVYILVKTKATLREGFYRTFPLSVARYQQYVNEVYGRGPGQTVLPALKVLQEEKKVVLTQGHRIVDPVLLAHDDGVIGTFSLEPGSINPGGVNEQGRPLIQPLPTGNIAVGKDLMDDERNVINDAFLITLFQVLVENPQMTATEVLERTREKGMLLAPTAGALAATFLGPMIERELDVLFRLQVLPPPPGILAEAGGGFQVEYDNPISRMARAENVAGFMRSLETALQFVQVTQDPRPLDHFNFDEAMPDIMDINGSPVKWTNDLKKVEEIRAERQQQAQQQQMIEAAPALAGAAKAMSGLEGNK